MVRLYQQETFKNFTNMSSLLLSNVNLNGKAIEKETFKMESENLDFFYPEYNMDLS